MLSARAPLVDDWVSRKDLARLGEPDDADDEEERHDRERQKPQPPVEHKEHGDDSEQQDNVPNGRDRRFDELLERLHVALQARHEPANLSLVHERQ